MYVDVKPGYSEQTVLTFPLKGNERFANTQSKLIVKFKQTPHENYRRKGDDLTYI